MVDYDQIRSSVANNSDSEKLAILRSESKRILSTLQGFSTLIYKFVQERGTPNMPDDFIEWCEHLVNGTAELQDLIEGITDREHRSIYKAEQEKRDQELEALLWRDAQAGLPELQPFTSLKEAIDHIAAQIGLMFNSQEVSSDYLSS